MAFYNGLFIRPINAYYRNTSLLLQFILIEFMTAYEECQKLTDLCHSQPSQSDNVNDLDQNSYSSQHISAALSRLVGASLDHERLVAWTFGKGNLARLKSYCLLFSHDTERYEKELLGMQHYTEKAWQHGLQAQMHFKGPEDARPQFLVSLEKMNQSMERFAKHIARVLTLFRDDENIVFFILRHHKLLETVYNPRFVTKLFSRMYPKGLRELKQFLKTKYDERGFTNISAVVDAQIAELEIAAL